MADLSNTSYNETNLSCSMYVNLIKSIRRDLGNVSIKRLESLFASTQKNNSSFNKADYANPSYDTQMLMIRSIVTSIKSFDYNTLINFKATLQKDLISDLEMEV